MLAGGVIFGTRPSPPGSSVGSGAGSRPQFGQGGPIPNPTSGNRPGPGLGGPGAVPPGSEISLSKEGLGLKK